MQEFSLSKVYQLLESSPVVLLTTAGKGKTNVMAMSWHMMVEFEPPLVACVVSSADYSFAVLRAIRECVIAILFKDWPVTFCSIISEAFIIKIQS
jgi:flavin reductase (DIM6/NTAB) family NADH-FMN oxidoreductase RutF